ncbi:MAG TPA: hypothetical protein VGE32_08780, partial [Cellvibrio sp.]
MNGLADFHKLIKELEQSMTPEERARGRLEWQQKLQRAAQRLEELYSGVPFHAERAKKDPGYWNRLACSAVNMGERPR